MSTASFLNCITPSTSVRVSMSCCLYLGGTYLTRQLRGLIDALLMMMVNMIIMIMMMISLAFT